MKSKEELLQILSESRKFNIWNNPIRPEDVQTGKCEYCGRSLGKNPLYVHVTFMGTCIPFDITETEIETVEQSQGCFAIGSGCAKKLFGAEILKYTKAF